MLNQPKNVVNPIWLCLIIFGIIAGSVHITSNYEQASIAWGLALLAGGLLVAFFGDPQFDLFSPGFFFGLSFAFLYGLALIIPFVRTSDSSYSRIIYLVLEYYPQAGLVTFLCLIGFFYGYTDRGIIFHGKKSSLFCWRASGELLKILWCFLIACGIASFVLLMRSNVYYQTSTEFASPIFYSFVGFIQNGLLVGTAISVAKYLKNLNNQFWKTAAFFSFLITLIFGIPSGSKTLAILGFIIVSLAWNYASGSRFSRKQAILAITFAMTFLLILMPFNAIYRSILLTNKTESQGLAKSFKFMELAITQMLLQDFNKTLDLSLDYMSARLSNISVVANVMRYQSQGGIVHWGGSYIRVLYLFIPRFIWPDKPAISISQQVAVELGYSTPKRIVLGEKVANYSIGITIIGEQVYNFTSLFAPLGMVLLGYLYRYIYEVFLAGLKEFNEIPIAIYTSLWYSLVYRAQESNFASILSGAIQYTTFLITIFLVLNFSHKKIVNSRLATKHNK